MTARDLVYGRRGGGWKDGDPLDTSPRCEVCGDPMVAGQKRRHGVCSPRLECCGAYTDLVGPLDVHAKAHRELELEAADAVHRRRGGRR